MTQRPFKQVDVFTDTAYLGNPLGVVLDGSGLSTEAMQRFTDWTNLSECTFLLPPTDEGQAAGADYRVRIFCPGRELPFAGHPTLGSCHAWLQAGGQPHAGQHVVQECGVGLVRIRRDGARMAFAAPPLRRSGPLDETDVALIARGLGLAAGLAAPEPALGQQGVEGKYGAHVSPGAPGRSTRLRWRTRRRWAPRWARGRDCAAAG